MGEGGAGSELFQRRPLAGAEGKEEEDQPHSTAHALHPMPKFLRGPLIEFVNSDNSKRFRRSK